MLLCFFIRFWLHIAVSHWLNQQQQEFLEQIWKVPRLVWNQALQYEINCKKKSKICCGKLSNARKCPPPPWKLQHSTQGQPRPACKSANKQAKTIQGYTTTSDSILPNRTTSYHIPCHSEESAKQIKNPKDNKILPPQTLLKLLWDDQVSCHWVPSSSAYNQHIFPTTVPVIYIVVCKGLTDCWLLD